MHNMNLETRMLTIGDYVDQFDEGVVERVREMVAVEDERKPWRNFREFDDFHLYHLVHPEWEDMSPGQLNNDTYTGGAAFYKAVHSFLNSRPQQKNLIKKIFPHNPQHWAHLRTLKAWEKEFRNHPQWHNYTSLRQMRTYSDSGSAFIAAYQRFVNNNWKTVKARARHMRRFLPVAGGRSWEDYQTIGDWKREFDAHPEWSSFSTKQMQKDRTHEGRRYIKAFEYWMDKKKFNGQRREELRLVLFPGKRRSWKHMETLDDWIKMWKKYPEWHYGSIAEMQKDRKAYAFEQAYRRWVRKQTEDPIEQHKLLRRILPSTINYWIHLESVDDWTRASKKFQFHKYDSTAAIKQDKDAHAFEIAYRRWVNSSTSDPRERQYLLRRIIPSAVKVWNYLEDPYDYRNELFNLGRSGRGRTIAARRAREEEGKLSKAAGHWIRQQTEDRKQRQRLREVIFSESSGFTLPPMLGNQEYEPIRIASSETDIRKLNIGRQLLLRMYSPQANVYLPFNGTRVLDCLSSSHIDLGEARCSVATIDQASDVDHIVSVYLKGPDVMLSYASVDRIEVSERIPIRNGFNYAMYHDWDGFQKLTKLVMPSYFQTGKTNNDAISFLRSYSIRGLADATGRNEFFLRKSIVGAQQEMDQNAGYVPKAFMELW
jgi:hypothetical protein